MWTMKAKSINAGGRSKRNRPWFFASLRSKRFQSSYCANVRAEAKKRFFCSCPGFLDEPREETLATQASFSPVEEWNPRGTEKSFTRGGSSPRSKPLTLLPTIFDVTEVAGITSFVAWKKPMIELLEAGLPEDPEPLSPLNSWVNPFPSRFINRTACCSRKVSSREDYKTVE